MTDDQMASLFPPKTEDDRIKGELAWVKPGDTITRFRSPISVYDVVRLRRDNDDARGWELTLEDGNKRLIGDFSGADELVEEKSLCVGARKVWFP